MTTGQVALAVAALVLLVLIRLRDLHFDLQRSVRFLTKVTYLLVVGAMWVLLELGRHGDAEWTLLGLALTAAIVVRAWAQERYLRGAEGVGLRQGRSTFSLGGMVRVLNPAPFRWLHRVFAVWFTWHFVSEVATSAPAEGGAYGLILIPFLLCLLGGPWTSLMLFFPVLPWVFFAFMPGLPWVLSNFLWLVVSVLRSPSDRRRNETKAFRASQDGQAWYYLS